MTLGSGALHSEQNASKTEPMEFLQLWILPDTASLHPAVQQQQFSKGDRSDKLLKVVGRDDGDPIRVHQDAAVYVAALSAGASLSHAFGPGRGGYLYLIEGALSMFPPPVGEGRERVSLSTGDAVKIFEEANLAVRAESPSELILVNVPLRYTPVGVWVR
jgi:redox-sensitive bicupin YhaK (pirin superfamily)